MSKTGILHINELRLIGYSYFSNMNHRVMFSVHHAKNVIHHCEIFPSNLPSEKRALHHHDLYGSNLSVVHFNIITPCIPGDHTNHISRLINTDTEYDIPAIIHILLGSGEKGQNGPSHPALTLPRQAVPFSCNKRIEKRQL